MSGAAFAAVMAAMAIQLPGVTKPVTTRAGYETVWLACAALAITVAVLAVRFDAQPRPRTAPATEETPSLRAGQLPDNFR